MADVSLDEFIRQKNFKPQMGKGRGNLHQAAPATVPGMFQNRKPAQGFDARSKLGPKIVVDARDKILTIKKSGKGDARNKIVQKQVQKGTFDARSKIQRQGHNGGNKAQIGGEGGQFTNPQGVQQLTRTIGGEGGQFTNPQGVQQLTRTLSNPNVAKGHIKMTNSGLQVTRQVPNTEISMSGNSLQVTKRMPGGSLPLREDAVPIIQIRNDRYQQKPQSMPTPFSHQAPPAQFSSQTGQPTYTDYSYPSTAYSNPPQRQYRDLDNPENNAASVELPIMPKIHISNIKNVEAAGMRPVARPRPAQFRAPPGAATISAAAKEQPQKVQPPPPRLQTAGVKRRQLLQEVQGPLKLGKGGGPGIQIGIGDPSPPKKSRAYPANPLILNDVEVIDLTDKEIVSPLQGFRVVVTNLFTGVTQDDIIELFGVVGPLKKAKLLKAGAAEVVYSNRDDAVKAVQKYHSRELDGQPMFVKMTTPSAAVVKMPVGDSDPDITGEALRLYKKPGGLGALPVAPIEVPTIHRALFKVGPPAPNKSVKFTVKI